MNIWSELRAHPLRLAAIVVTAVAAFAGVYGVRTAELAPRPVSVEATPTTQRPPGWVPSVPPSTEPEPSAPVSGPEPPGPTPSAAPVSGSPPAEPTPSRAGKSRRTVPAEEPSTEEPPEPEPSAAPTTDRPTMTPTVCPSNRC